MRKPAAFAALLPGKGSRQAFAFREEKNKKPGGFRRPVSLSARKGLGVGLPPDFAGLRPAADEGAGGFRRLGPDAGMPAGFRRLGPDAGMPAGFRRRQASPVRVSGPCAAVAASGWLREDPWRRRLSPP